MKRKNTPEAGPAEQETNEVQNTASVQQSEADDAGAELNTADALEEDEDDPDLEEISLTPNKNDSKKKGKKTAIIVSTLLVVIIAAACIGRNALASNQALSISVAEVDTGSVEETISTSGLVKSEQKKTYYSPVAATIANCDLQVGDSVTSGQTLVAFDTTDLELAAEKASLTATSSSAEYNHNLSESSESKSDYEIASANVELYKLLIVAQRAYVNDIKYAIENKTYDVSQSAQCVRDSLVKKIDAKGDESTSVSKEINSISQNSISNPNDPDHQRYIDLQNRLADISNEKTKLSNAMSNTSSLVNTSEKNKQLAEAQNMLSDMESYLAKDQSKMETAEKAILDANQKEKYKADADLSKLSAAQATDDLSLAQAGIQSDFTGIVTEVPAATGSLATKGGALLTVESTEDVYVDVTITKYNLSKVEIGQNCDITIAGNPYTGKITQINKKAQKNDQGTPIVTAKVHIDNPDETIFLDVEAKVIIHVAEANDAVLAPVEAINTDNDGIFCYIVKDGIVERRQIESGVTSDTFIQITSGLSKGDLLIDDYTLPIEEGMKVNPIMPTEDVTTDTGAKSDTETDAASN